MRVNVARGVGWPVMCMCRDGGVDLVRVMLNLKVSTEGLVDQSRLSAWTRSAQREINRAVRRAMYDAKPEIEAKLAAHIAAKLQVSRQSFARSMRGYVAARDPDRLPVLAFASKAAWLGAHESGAKIGGGGKGVLIPINTKKGRRIGMRAFQRLITGLMEAGNLYFQRRGGKVIAYAENLPGNDFELGKFNRRVGADRHKKRGRSKEIPIAILVPRVQLKRRLDVRGLAVGSFGPLLAAKIQARLDEIGR